jgi:hypothetical protein
MNWKQIICTAIVTGLVSVGTGMLLFKIQNKQPILTYNVSESVPFQGDSANLSIYLVEIKNDGKKFVEDVQCNIDVQSANIVNKRFKTDDALPFTDICKSNNCRISIPLLNPNELLSVSILLSSNNQSEIKPKVILRAKGITGKPLKSQSSKSNEQITFIATIVSAYTAMLSLVIVTGRKRLFSVLLPFLPKRINQFLDDNKHSGEQEKVLAYLFGLQGIHPQVEYYLTHKSAPSYWSESDRIASIAISSNDNNTAESMKHVLLNLLNYARINPSSQAIIHYNIARIAKYLGIVNESKIHLYEAIKVLPKLMETRLSIDPIFSKDKTTHPG